MGRLCAGGEVSVGGLVVAGLEVVTALRSPKGFVHVVKG